MQQSISVCGELTIAKVLLANQKGGNENVLNESCRMWMSEVSKEFRSSATVIIQTDTLSAYTLSYSYP